MVEALEQFHDAERVFVGFVLGAGGEGKAQQQA
jgi:hypothetical protein